MNFLSTILALSLSLSSGYTSSAQLIAATPSDLDAALRELYSQAKYLNSKSEIVTDLDPNDVEILRKHMATTLGRAVSSSEASATSLRALAQARSSGPKWSTELSLRSVKNEGNGLTGNYADARLPQVLREKYPGASVKLTSPGSQSSDAIVSYDGNKYPATYVQSKVKKNPTDAIKLGIDDLIAFAYNPMSRKSEFALSVTSETVEHARNKGLIDPRGYFIPKTIAPIVDQQLKQLQSETGSNGDRARGVTKRDVLEIPSKLESNGKSLAELERDATTSKRDERSLNRELRKQNAANRVAQAAAGEHTFDLPKVPPRIRMAVSAVMLTYGIQSIWTGAGSLGSGQPMSTLDATGHIVNIMAGGLVVAEVAGLVKSSNGVVWLLVASEAIQLTRFANGELSGDEYAMHLISTGGAVGGAYVGGMAGASIGLLLGPGGAVIGLYVGEYLGALAGSQLGEIVHIVLFGSEQQARNIQEALELFRQ